MATVEATPQAPSRIRQSPTHSVDSQPAGWQRDLQAQLTRLEPYLAAGRIVTFAAVAEEEQRFFEWLVTGVNVPSIFCCQRDVTSSSIGDIVPQFNPSLPRYRGQSPIAVDLTSLPYRGPFRSLTRAPCSDFGGSMEVGETALSHVSTSKIRHRHE